QYQLFSAIPPLAAATRRFPRLHLFDPFPLARLRRYYRPVAIPDANATSEEILDWLKAEYNQSFVGWGFSVFRGRIENAPNEGRCSWASMS
ncbi:MAG: hypothetical protein ACRDHX_00885, partial [Chloroflexota bacterium]